MANEIPPMIVEILVETDKLKAGLANVQSQLEKVGSGAERTSKHTEGLKNQFTELGGKLVKGLGLLEIANFMQESAKAASEDAQSLVILNKTLQATTGATKAQTMAVNDQLEAMAEQSGTMMSQMRPAFDVLVRSTKDSTKALELQKLALDVSAGAHKPLQSVVMALSRAYQGNAGALNKIVPDVKNASNKIEYLTKTFHGAAKAAGDANPMLRLQVIFEKIKVTLGQALLPVFDALIQILKPLMPIFTMLGQIISMVVKAVMPMVTALAKALMPVLSTVVKVVMDLVQVAMKPAEKIFKQMLPVITLMAKFLSDLLIAIEPLLKVIIKLLPFILLFQNILIKIGSVVLPPLIQILDSVLVPLIAILSRAIEIAFDWFEKLANYLKGIFQPIIDALGKAFQRLGDLLLPVWNNILKPMLDNLMAMMGIKAEPVIAPKLDTSGLDSASGLTNADFGGLTDSTAKSGVVSHAQAVQKELLKAQTDYQKAVKAANDQYAADVKAQIQAFRDQFKQATQVNIGDLFAQGYRSADSLVSALQTKLAGIKNFANDAAKLAGAGFSSTFISQVMAQGPMMGDQMAQALLTATPDTAKQIQDLFAQTQDASQHGVDALSTSLKDQFVDATKALTDALKAATDTLNRTLSSLGVSVTTQATVATGSVTGSSTALAGAVRASSGGGVGHNNIVINNNVQTNATADHIARVTVSSIKFGAPLTAAQSDYMNAHVSRPPVGFLSQIPASPTH